MLTADGSTPLPATHPSFSVNLEPGLDRGVPWGCDLYTFVTSAAGHMMRTLQKPRKTRPSKRQVNHRRFLHNMIQRKFADIEAANHRLAAALYLKEEENQASVPAAEERDAAVDASPRAAGKSGAPPAEAAASTCGDALSGAKENSELGKSQTVARGDDSKAAEKQEKEPDELVGLTPTGFRRRPRPAGHPPDGPPGPVSNAPGPVRNTPGPVRNDPGPVRNDPGPVRNDPGPVRNDPGPVRNAPGPVSNAPGPVSNAPGPVRNAPGPVRNAPGDSQAAQPDSGVIEFLHADPAVSPGLDPLPPESRDLSVQMFPGVSTCALAQKNMADAAESQWADILDLLGVGGDDGGYAEVEAYLESMCACRGDAGTGAEPAGFGFMDSVTDTRGGGGGCQEAAGSQNEGGFLGGVEQQPPSSLSSHSCCMLGHDPNLTPFEGVAQSFAVPLRHVRPRAIPTPPHEEDWPFTDILEDRASVYG